MRLLLFVICSIFFISSISNVIAQDSSHVFFILIQIIQRDDDGTLITYIETDDVSEVNDSLLNFLLDELIEDENIKTTLLTSEKEEINTIQASNDAGARDGISGKGDLYVDGMDISVHIGILKELETICKV